MDLPSDQSRLKRWRDDVWLRAVVLHPALSPVLLALAFELTRHTDSTPAIHAVRIAAATSGLILTLVMAMTRPGLEIKTRIGLIATTATATIVAFYLAMYVFFVVVGVADGGMGD